MRSNGIVLRAINYTDSQMIVTIFTEAAGTVSFLVRASRSGRSRTKASTWQSLALVEVVWEPRLQTSLQHPRELALWRPWRSLAMHPYKAAMTLFMSEFLYHALRGEQQNPPLFGFMTNALTWFDESEEHFSNFHIIFLLRLTRFLGFEPNVDDWHDGSFFDLDAAMFTARRPLHVHYLEPVEASLVPKFLRMDLRSMRAVGLNRAIRQRVLEIVTEFYRLHVPEFPELRSLAVLAEVFE